MKQGLADVGQLIAPSRRMPVPVMLILLRRYLRGTTGDEMNTMYREVDGMYRMVDGRCHQVDGAYGNRLALRRRSPNSALRHGRHRHRELKREQDQEKHEAENAKKFFPELVK